MAAIVEAPPALVSGGVVVGGCAPAVVAVLALVEGVVEAPGEELPHAVSARDEAATNTSGQTRKRDMNDDSSEDSPCVGGWSARR